MQKITPRENATPKQRLAIEALNKFPGKPKQTIAKWLRKKYPVEFKSIEAARGVIRAITGAHNFSGENAYVIDKRKPAPLKIPKGDKQAKPTFRVPKGRWLICSDWHVPYHDEIALDAAIRYAVDNKCDGIYINGDAIDFYQASRWSRDPNARNVWQELQVLHEILDMLPFEKRIYKIGNHEARLTRRLWESTPELAVLPRFAVDEVLEIKQRGFQVVHSVQHALAGKLNLWHGHELPRGLVAAVNPARGIWLRVKDGGACGHFHKTSQHTETSGAKNKKLTVCHSIGCLCDMSPDYASINAWNLGFATIEIGQRGDYQFDNFLVDRGKVYSS